MQRTFSDAYVLEDADTQWVFIEYMEDDELKTSHAIPQSKSLPEDKAIRNARKIMNLDEPDD
ncbi:hypothetical protein [Ponticaulis profundi]|uniref:Uncharacterized protein n=1 Tax=Ponticaulis profundi TaxID=2665222 RepID=A0ABW1S8K1_9PROT